MRIMILFLALVLSACSGNSDSGSTNPTVVSTEALGPFVGGGAKLHPDNEAPEPIAYYGTDLGFSYVHKGRLHFLFGDTWATEAYAPIEASTGSRYDDSFGSIPVGEWPDPATMSKNNMPILKLGQNLGTTEASAMNPGHAMDLGKTPMAGFSNGSREFAIFNITKPQGCRSDDDCGNDLSCDAGLGYVGTLFSAEENLTIPCIDGGGFCQADTMVDGEGEDPPVEGVEAAAVGILALVFRVDPDEHGGELIVAKVNTDNNPTWAMHYGVQGIPTMLFLHHGELISEQVGAVPEEFLNKLVDEFLINASVSVE